MRLPRVTIGRLMILVVVAAVGTWAGVRAREVYLDTDYHTHVYAHWVNRDPSMTWDGAAVPPFWPRYWRHLLGLPWKGQPVCGRGADYLAEACSFADPEVFAMQAIGKPLVVPKAVREMHERMLKHWDGRHTPGWSPDQMPR